MNKRHYRIKCFKTEQQIDINTVVKCTIETKQITKMNHLNETEKYTLKIITPLFLIDNTLFSVTGVRTSYWTRVKARPQRGTKLTCF
jgi:hypothetical protein